VSPSRRKFWSWLPLGCSLAACAVLFHLGARASQQQATAKQQAQVYFALLWDSDRAVVVLDPRFRIAGFSPGAEQLFGRKEAEVLGGEPWFLVPKRFRESGERSAAFFDEYNMTHAMNVVEGVLETRDGCELSVRMTSIPVVNGHGTFHVVMICPSSKS